MTLGQYDWSEMISATGQIVIIVLFVVLLVRGFLVRNMPRVGGKIGPRQVIDPPSPLPDGFSGVYARAMTIFAASSDATSFSSLKEFLRHGTVRQPALMRIYRVAGCKTEIEIPAGASDYERIDARHAAGDCQLAGVSAKVQA